MNLDQRASELLLESIRDYAIYMLDPAGHVTSWNPGARALKGYSADEVIGKDFAIFFTPEDVARAEPEREIVDATRGRLELEGWRVRKDGSRFWADVIITPLLDESKKLIGFAKITRDLTERHEREEDRVRHAKIEEALRVRDVFFSDLRSRLDTVLMSLRVHVETLTKTVASAQSASLESRLQMLEWGLRKLDRSVSEVVALSQKVSDRLARELDRGSSPGSSPREPPRR